MRPAVLALAAVAMLPVACGDDGTAAAPRPSPEPPLAPRTLAMVDGWREDLGGSADGSVVGTAPADAFGVLEVAYDDSTVRALWDAVVPPGLPARSGDPHEPGLYGDLADVDLDEQAVVLWSSGESGSCSSWFGGVRTEDDVVRVTTAGEGGTCTADYQPYQVLVAVDRDDVPPPDELPSARGAFGGGGDHLRLVVSPFPCCPAPG